MTFCALAFAGDMRVHPLYKHVFVPSGMAPNPSPLHRSAHSKVLEYVNVRVLLCAAVAPTLALIGLLWKSLRNPQFELQVCLWPHWAPSLVPLPWLQHQLQPFLLLPGNSTMLSLQ